MGNYLCCVNHHIVYKTGRITDFFAKWVSKRLKVCKKLKAQKPLLEVDSKARYMI